MLEHKQATHKQETNYCPSILSVFNVLHTYLKPWRVAATQSKQYRARWSKDLTWEEATTHVQVSFTSVLPST